MAKKSSQSIRKSSTPKAAKPKADRAPNRDTSHASGLPMDDIRHPAAKRKNNPPAKIAAEGTVPVIAKAEFRRIRDSAGIVVDETGGAAAIRPYTVDEISRLIQVVSAKRRANSRKPAEAWKKLLQELPPDAPMTRQLPANAPVGD